MSPAEAAFLRDLHEGFRDHRRFSAESLVIKDEETNLVPFVWRQAQIRLKAAIDKQRSQGKPVRIIILKSRRAGFSTGVAGEFFIETAFSSGQETLIVAHENDAAVNLFRMYNRFRENYNPFGANPAAGFEGIVLPELKSLKDTSDSGYLEWKNGSSIRIATAKNLEGKRSFGFSRIHLSEFAFYPDAATLMTGLMPTVSMSPSTMVVIESTANGAGGEFYEMWQRANDPQRPSDWIPLFFPWWQDEDNVRPLEKVDGFRESLTAEERAEQLKYGLTLEQLNWRRWAIENVCFGDEERFRQEYPGCPEEAFLTTGNPRFDHRVLSRFQAQEGQLGNLELTIDEMGRHRVLFKERDRGPFRLFTRPQPGRQYVIGVDTASGKDATGGKGKRDLDYSVACVLDHDSGEQVAIYRSRLPENLFANEVYTLGAWYNWAFIVPEITGGWGDAMLQPLITAQIDPVSRPAYPLERIYGKRNEQQTSTPAIDDVLGFDTNTRTKPKLIGTLDTALHDGSVFPKCPVTLQELRVFINNDSKLEATAGNHDDCVIALALAVIGLQRAPRLRLLQGGTNPAYDPAKPVHWSQGARRRVFGT